MKKNAEPSSEGCGISQKFTQLKTFIEKSQLELKKVLWPTKEETLQTSAAVLLLVFVLAVFLGSVDFGLSKIISAILS